MKQKISTQLATGFALIVLITVLLIGAVANGLINRQFERYVALQRKNFSEQLAESLPSQYDERNGEWNVDYIHGIGMYALKDGYLIRLLDRENHVVWDAENHDMTLCHQVMQEIRTDWMGGVDGCGGNGNHAGKTVVSSVVECGRSDKENRKGRL